MGSEVLDLTSAIPYFLHQPHNSSINFSSLMDVLIMAYKGDMVKHEFPFFMKLSLD
jgi:hypothetical protein